MKHNALEASIEITGRFWGFRSDRNKRFTAPLPPLPPTPKNSQLHFLPTLLCSTTSVVGYRCLKSTPVLAPVHSETFVDQSLNSRVFYAKHVIISFHAAIQLRPVALIQVFLFSKFFLSLISNYDMKNLTHFER